MSYVDLTIKDLKRMLSILSIYFGVKPMGKDDKDLKNKLEVMLKAEIEWDSDEVTL